MALAFDAAVLDGFWNSGVSSDSISHTCTGSNLFLVATVANYNSVSRTANSVTYNSVAMTRANGITASLESATQNIEVWYLDAPATGANTVAVTWSGSCDFSRVGAASYTGKTTTGIEGSNATQNTSSSTSSPACSVTITHSDCWMVGYGYTRSGTVPSAGTATTSRATSGEGHIIGDSNGVVSTGSQTLAFTLGSANTWPGVVSVAFSEANAGGAASVTYPQLERFGHRGAFRGMLH